MATKKKSSNPLSKKTEWTITEFQMWLAGAYSLQGQGWIPNAEQWEMIIEIIYKLKDDKPSPAPKQSNPSPQPARMFPQPPQTFQKFPNDPTQALGSSELPPEANMSLSQLRDSEKGTVGGKGGAIGVREIKTGTFE